MANKMKVVDKFMAVKALLSGDKVENFSIEDAVAFIDERITITENKNAKGGVDRKPTKTQLENEQVKADILAFLTEQEKPVTIGDIMKGIGIESNQKVSALVSQMLTIRKGIPNPEGCVVRSEVKGKAYFALATEE